ncbi:unnamed protein product [Penicillium nalgiovense]|uniref:MARVEL domain-containing protein n=1 Tax=Penicillium nalgiovense TaxID=60175 RepID=A0A9W4MNZ5_PENNA|nr:unnamed protein product [Penicillium nalgiovense]CAG7952167.1 unnamed protein product [Penicillium nalgiovense]CAG7967569.1 unnamed protein product [Penicillium nalgiovense]CAG7968624.1 unnamed protein product [Penicillium nalgiovense]CAG7969260.1 unnamed protein product [Penicillium nalgiovense]
MSTALNHEPSPSFCIEAIPRKEKKWLSLFSLRFDTVLCTMIAIICFAWTMVQHHEGVVSTDGLGEAWSSLNLGTASYGFVWSTIFLIVVFCNCAFHPGVIIAFDCIAFIAQIITVCFHLHELVFYNLGGYYSGLHDTGPLYGAECLGCSMILIGILFNLILCVRASIACHRLRKAAKQPGAKQTFDA